MPDPTSELIPRDPSPGTAHPAHPDPQEAKPTERLAVETHGLTRTFGDLRAVDGIDLAVPAGSFFGFLGPNGAGKSTTIKCLTGLLRPSGGTMRILGLDPLAQPVAVKRRLGVIPEDLALFERLTGAENLAFVGRVHGLPTATVAERSAELLDLFELTDAAGTLVADYSHGMRKKLSLAVALLPSPRLLFLDEPFEGVDAVASRLIKGLLHEFVERGGTIFLTSHVLEIVERLASHVAIIHRGRLVVQGPMAELRAAAAAAGAAGQTLEEIFLGVVGAEATEDRELAWL